MSWFSRLLPKPKAAEEHTFFVVDMRDVPREDDGRINMNGCVGMLVLASCAKEAARKLAAGIDAVESDLPREVLAVEVDDRMTGYMYRISRPGEDLEPIRPDDRTFH